jgi:hypothetical protein
MSAEKSICLYQGIFMLGIPTSPFLWPVCLCQASLCPPSPHNPPFCGKGIPMPVSARRPLQSPRARFAQGKRVLSYPLKLIPVLSGATHWCNRWSGIRRPGEIYRSPAPLAFRIAPARSAT